MEQTKLKIEIIENITHDVLRIITEKPKRINFIPGQAAEISINKTDWEEEKRAFTFTSLPENDYLEFTIKVYPFRNSVTKEFLHLKKNDELILHDIFGSITYRDEGVFIAGGAGITPFISIFRQLQLKNKIGNNKLIFANKTGADVIHEEMFKKFLGKNFINILSEEKKDGYAHGHINDEFLKTNIADLDTQIYLCGPDPMMVGIEQQLKDLGGGKFIIKEKF